MGTLVIGEHCLIELDTAVYLIFLVALVEVGM